MFRRRNSRLKKSEESVTEEIEMQTLGPLQQNLNEDLNGLQVNTDESGNNRGIEMFVKEKSTNSETDGADNVDYLVPFVVSQDESNPWQAVVKDEFITTNLKSGVSLKRSVNAFLAVTSIHGLTHLRREFSNVVRFFYFIVLLSCFGYAITYVKNFKNNPVTVTDIDNTEHLESEMLFPAVTVCSMNKAQTQEIDKSIKLAKEVLGTNITLDQGNKEIITYLSKLFYKQSILFKTEYYNTSTNVDLNITGFLLQVMQPCQEMLLKCLWRDKEFNCMDLFRIVPTPSGICCGFNTMSHFLDVTEREPPKRRDPPQHWLNYISNLKHYKARSLWEKPLTVFGTGPKNGLTVVVNADVDNYGYSLFNTAGFLVKIHNPHDEPGLMSTGLHISTGRQNFISVKSEIFTTAEDLDTDPVTRNCFYYLEKPLPRIGYYRYEDCVNQCINMVLESVHHCSLHFLAEPLHFCAGVKIPLNGNISVVEEKVKEKLTSANGSWESPCTCKMNCQDTKFRSTLSYLHLARSPLQMKKLLQRIRSTNLLAGNRLHSKIENLTIEKLDRYVRDNIAIVRVEMSSWTSMRLQRRTFFTPILFFANAGGLVALFIGFSVQSFIEVIFHLARAIWKYITKYPRMKTSLNR